MGHGIVQPLTTLSGGLAAGPGLIVQPESLYANVSGYRDLTVLMRVNARSGAAITMRFETSPSRDEKYFQLIDPTATFTVSAGLTTLTLNAANVAVPIARYVRWKLSSTTGLWSMTFRVSLSVAS